MATVADVMIKDFLRISTSDSLASVVSKLHQKDERTAVVFEKDKFKGIFDRTVLLTAKIDPFKSKVKEFIKHPPIVEPNTSLVEAAELMYNAYPCILIVQKGKDILGIVRARDFIYKIKDIPELKKLNASEIMTKDVITFNYAARLGEVLSVMREKGIGRVPIVDKAGKVLSVLSFTDIAERILMEPKDKIRGHSETTPTSKGSKAWTPNRIFLLDTNVGDEASRTVVSVKPDTKLSIAINKMYEFKISDVIVAEDKKPVGIITTRDLLETYIRLKTPEYWPIQYYGLKTLKPFQEKMIKELVQESFEKIRRAYFKDITYLLVHIKTHEAEISGKEEKRGRTKWSIRLRLALPSHVFTTERVHFNLGTAMSWTLKEMEMVLQRYKSKSRERHQETGKKGRRAMFERFIRKKKDEMGGPEPYSPLVKR